MNMKATAIAPVWLAVCCKYLCCTVTCAVLQLGLQHNVMVPVNVLAESMASVPYRVNDDVCSSK